MDRGRIRVDVDKFGGKTASVTKPTPESDKSSLTTVKKILKRKVRDGKKVVIPVSAYANTTNILESLNSKLISGEITNEAQMRSYLHEHVRIPHLTLAKDLGLKRWDAGKYVGRHIEGIVSSGREFLNLKSRLNNQASLSGIYSPAIFMDLVRSYYMRSITSKSVHDGIEDIYHIEGMRGCIDDIITRGERIMAPFYAQFLGKDPRTFGKPRVVFAEKLFATDDNYGSATINMNRSITNASSTIVSALLDPDIKAVVVPGFYGADKLGKACCFGRGGSDLTAVALSYLLKQFHPLEVSDPTLTKDTKAIMAVNPKEVYIEGNGELPELFKKSSTPFPWLNYNDIPTIPRLNYNDSMEISAVHTGAVTFAEKYGINIAIRNVNQYFGSDLSVICGEPTEKGMKLVGGTEDAVLLEIMGQCKDLPGEAVVMSLPFFRYGINISKFIHYVGDSLILANRGLGNLDEAIGVLENEFGRVNTSEASQIRVTGDVRYQDKLDFEKLSRQAGSVTLGPWHETYTTLSDIFPRVNDKDMPINYYKGLMTAVFMLYYGNRDNAMRLSTELGNLKQRA